MVGPLPPPPCPALSLPLPHSVSALLCSPTPVAGYGSPPQAHMVVGAAVTIAELIAALERAPSPPSPAGPPAAATTSAPHPTAGPKVTGSNPMLKNSTNNASSTNGSSQQCPSVLPPPRPPPFAALASMLRRIAGAHVRQAGTAGGNLVLAKRHGLESDLATALLGWGATGGRLAPGLPAAPAPPGLGMGCGEVRWPGWLRWRGARYKAGRASGGAACRTVAT